MGKIQFLHEQIESLRSYGEQIMILADSLERMFSSVPEDSAEVPKALTEVLFADVKSKATELARLGYRSELGAILREFGAGRLSELAPEDYNTFLERISGIHIN